MLQTEALGLSYVMHLSMVSRTPLVQAQKGHLDGDSLTRIFAPGVGALTDYQCLTIHDVT